MLAVLTGCSALVIAVAAFVVAALTLRAASNGYARMDSLSNRIALLGAEIEKRTPESLRAEVDDLRGALDTIRSSNRREFGSIWGRLGGRPPVEGRAEGRAANDDSFEAMLQLQAAPSPEPK